MITEKKLSPSELMALSPEDRLSAIRQQIGQEDSRKPLAHEVCIETEPDRNTIHLYLSDDEIGFLYQLLDEKERYCRSIIKRNEDYPTYNAKADRSNNRQKETISRIEYIRAQITDQ